MQSVTSTIPVMRPQLPTTAEIMPYLLRIDETRHYSNHGQLLREFEAGLAEHFGVPEPQLAVVANGTVALSAALLAVGARAGSKCLLPSWTFVASAAAAWAANMRPHFVDVDESTWMLDPGALKQRDLSDVGAVMVVSPFGAPVDVQAWDDFTVQTGVPVIVDGAAAFDTVTSVHSARPGKSPTMISLHATKVFGIGEGGIVVSTDSRTMQRLKQICNFGVWGSDEQILGYNGKLSEYHAAVGLAMLERWPERRKAVSRLTQLYVERLSEIPSVSLAPNYGDRWVSCYCNVRIESDTTTITNRLASLGVETRRWWKTGVHRQSAYSTFSSDELPVTEKLGAQVFGLPFFHDMTDEQIDAVLDRLQASL